MYFGCGEHSNRMMEKHTLLPIEGSLRMNRDTGNGLIPSHSELLEMTAEVVSAYVGNNNLESSRLPGVINTVFSSGLSQITT